MSDEEKRGRRIQIDVEDADQLAAGMPSDEDVDALFAETEAAPEGGPAASELEELRKQYEEEHDRHLRAVAELQNYKRRVTQDKALQLQFANEQLLSSLLPVLDHFQMALDHADADPTAFAQGVAMILQQLRDITGSFGLEAVPTVGEYFDPAVHEAVERVETDAACEGSIVGEVRKGYKLNGRLLRAAQVRVAVPLTK